LAQEGTDAQDNLTNKRQKICIDSVEPLMEIP
jgi:hypothetical protein